MEKLAKHFVKLATAFGEAQEALYCGVEKEKRMHIVSLYFRTVKLQLVYSCRWVDIAPPSVLYCRVYVDKNCPIFLHLPEVLHYLGAKDFRACYFPYIETKERMELCFTALADILRDHLPAIEQLGASEKAEEILRDWLKRELDDQELSDPADELTVSVMKKMQPRQEFARVATFTIMDGYQAFLRGDLKKARKSYEKRKSLSPYEEELRDFLAAGGTVQPMPPGCYAADDFKRFSGQMQDWKGIGLLYPVFAGAFCLLLAVVNGVLAWGTLFYSDVPWWFGLVLGVMPAMFCYALLQKQITALRYRKERKQALAFIDITDGQKWVRWFAAIVLVLVLVAELLFCIAVPNMGMRLYEDHGVYYTEEEKLERFSYDQVTAVYHISARYNEYGGRVERDSYVLFCSDGRTIDLDCAFGLRKQYQVISTLFPELTVQELDSDRDLP